MKGNLKGHNILIMPLLFLNRDRHKVTIRNILKSVAYTYRGIKVEGRSEDMEYAKDEILEMGYCTKLNRIERKDEPWISSFSKRVKRHKLLSCVVIAFFMFTSMNLVMLYSFMKILQNI